MYKEKQFNKIIKQICQEKSIQYEELSDDWIIKLTKENRNKFIVGYKFDLNNQATSEICNDKFALYAVLKSEEIPVIEYNILFKNEEDKLEKYFYEYNQNVVLKPNNGTCGNNVLHICEYDKLKNENISADYIPKFGEKIEYEWRFNLSRGAKIADVDDEEKNILMNMINNIIKVINLKFVSIDIVKLTNNQYMVMEINSGVMMENLVKLQDDGIQIAKSVYGEAIDLMFI